MCLRRALEKYITGAMAPVGAALDRAALRRPTRERPILSSERTLQHDNNCNGRTLDIEEVREPRQITILISFIHTAAGVT
jgi:hypothetical protein